MSHQVRTISQHHAFAYNRVIASLDNEVRTITMLANEYRKQHADLPWAECIRLAEKHHTGETA